jgi:hypothetical protein
MMTVDDVLQHILEDIRGYSGCDNYAAVQELLVAHLFDFHIAITDDVEETELNYLDRYGRGHTFYFRLRDYDHGRELAAALYRVFTGVEPEMGPYTGAQFEPGTRLYFFVHLQKMVRSDLGIAVA